MLAQILVIDRLGKMKGMAASRRLIMLQTEIAFSNRDKNCKSASEPLLAIDVEFVRGCDTLELKCAFKRIDSKKE